MDPFAGFNESRHCARVADAIIGVSFFADVDPDDFARFDRGFISLFKILAGDSWINGLDELNSDGTMNVPAAVYICSFRLVVEWILLQVDLAGFTWAIEVGAGHSGLYLQAQNSDVQRI